MKISVITICYNNENEIISTVRSVINQTYTEIEYIIVDGHSKDKTLERINGFKDKISKIISEPDSGIYDAINKGIKYATGDIVGLIHAGDELYDNNVITKIAHHFSNCNIDAMYGHSKIYSKDGSRLIRINKSPEYRKNLFRIGWFPSHQSFYAKRELFDRLGYYKKCYSIAGDYELLFRFIYVNKIKVKLLNEFVVKFKYGGESTNIKNILSQNSECTQAWKDNDLEIPFYTIPLKLLRKINQFILAFKAQQPKE